MKPGVVLGTWHGRTVSFYGEGHILMVAPSGAGKTQSVAIPTCLAWPGSLIVYDPKGELYPLTAGWRSRFSRVVRLDPTSPYSDCYDPVRGIRLGVHAPRDAQLFAEILANPDGEPIHGGSARHFYEIAVDFLLAVTLHGLYTRQATTMAGLDHFFMTESSLEDILKEMGRTAHTPAGTHPAVKRGVVLVQSLADRELSSMRSTASRALRLVIDPLVARMTSTSDFLLADIRQRGRPFTLYLTVPYSDQERLRPWSRLLIRQVLDACTQGLTGTEDVRTGRHRPWRHRVLLLIDEVQSLKHMPALTSALTFVRGYGLTICAITPSLTQLGEDAAHYVEGCHLRLLYALAGQAAERFSRMTGEVEVEKARESVARETGALLRTRTTVSQSREREPLFSATQIQYMPKGGGLLLVGNGGYPARISKAPAHQLWRYRSKLGLPVERAA